MSEPSTPSVVVRLPTRALEQVNRWADQMGLAHAEFHTRALVAGSRVMASSLQFMPSLSSKLRKRAIQAADDSITPRMVGQVITGKGAGENETALETEIDLAISLPADMQAQFEQAIQTSGMMPQVLLACICYGCTDAREYSGSRERIHSSSIGTGHGERRHIRGAHEDGTQKETPPTGQVGQEGREK